MDDQNTPILDIEDQSPPFDPEKLIESHTEAPKSQHTTIRVSRTTLESLLIYVPRTGTWDKWLYDVLLRVTQPKE